MPLNSAGPIVGSAIGRAKVVHMSVTGTPEPSFPCFLDSCVGDDARVSSYVPLPLRVATRPEDVCRLRSAGVRVVPGSTRS